MAQVEVLHAPLAGLERCLSGQTPYTDPVLMDIRAFLLDPAAGRLVLSVTDAMAAPGRQSASVSHGGFDDDQVTRGSLGFLIAQ